MKSPLVAKMLEEMPPYITNFTRIYGDLIVRVHTLLQEKGLSQRDLAIRLGKSPSEISKWLNGVDPHNLTLLTIAKLEAELGEVLLEVPERKLGSRKSKDSKKAKSDVQTEPNTKKAQITS